MNINRVCRRITCNITKRLMNTNPSAQVLNPHINEFCLFNEKTGYTWTSLYGNINHPNTTIHEHIWKDLNRWQNKTAMICGVTNRKYTYSKLRDHCAVFANNLLTKFKLKMGDTIALCLPNLPEYPIPVLGASEANIYATTINPMYNGDEMSRQLKLCKPKLIVGTVDGYKAIKEACTLANLPSTKILIIKTYSGESIPSDTIDFFEMIETKGVNLNDFQFDRNIDPNRICLIPFSSGTTGLPKGVMLSHTNVNTIIEILRAKLPEETMVYPTTDDFQDVLPCILPFFHMSGLACNLLSKLALGCKMVTLPKFHIETFANSLINHRSTILHVVPPMAIVLATHPAFQKAHTESLRLVLCGAAPIGALDAERFRLKAPTVKFSQAYGLTETSPLILVGSIGDNNYASAGFPTANTEIRIVEFNDPNLCGLGPNQNGELIMRGPQMMKGYLNNLDATMEMITDDGWLRTGDMACYDSDGYFYIKDRYKEVIKVKGHQVAPAELEEVLRDHPKVMDAGVIGVPHPVKGEVPLAFIVKRGSVQLTEKELKEYVAKKLIEYKHLEGGVRFLNSIPKNASGKIMRKQLKEML